MSRLLISMSLSCSVSFIDFYVPVVFCLSVSFPFQDIDTFAVSFIFWVTIKKSRDASPFMLTHFCSFFSVLPLFCLPGACLSFFDLPVS
jgi:hypothetical protein